MPATEPARAARMTRFDAVRAALATAPDDALVVICNGMIGREAWTAGDRPTRFYMIGAMGLAPSIALGLAAARPERRVVCFDGDGNLLMGMGALATIGALRPANFYHVVFDNEAHGSTGDQATVSAAVPLEKVAAACGYAHAGRAEAPGDVGPALAALFQARGPACLLVKVARGNVKGIGRVARTPRQIADDFREAACRRSS